MPRALLEAIPELPLPHQLALLRRYYKITQTELAKALGVRQGYYSRLEEEDKHLLSHYAKAASLLGSRVVLIPPGAGLKTRGRG